MGLTYEIRRQSRKKHVGGLVTLFHLLHLWITALKSWKGSKSTCVTSRLAQSYLDHTVHVVLYNTTRTYVVPTLHCLPLRAPHTVAEERRLDLLVIVKLSGKEKYTVTNKYINLVFDKTTNRICLLPTRLVHLRVGISWTVLVSYLNTQ